MALETLLHNLKCLLPVVSILGGRKFSMNFGPPKNGGHGILNPASPSFKTKGTIFPKLTMKWRGVSRFPRHFLLIFHFFLFTEHLPLLVLVHFCPMLQHLRVLQRLQDIFLIIVVHFFFIQNLHLKFPLRPKAISNFLTGIFKFALFHQINTFILAFCPAVIHFLKFICAA